MTRVLLVAVALVLLAAHAGATFAASGCPQGDKPYPRFYDDAALFNDAVAKVAATSPSGTRLSGIIVPHHLVADRLVALGFRAASGFAYRRIVILSPDHFRRSDRPFATTTRGFETVLGHVATDAGAARQLLSAKLPIEESCLFDRDHGVRALLPFIRHYFPGVSVVPVAISIRSNRGDWDRLAQALEAIVDDETLVVESTDFSHYLPQHRARIFDQQTLNVLAAGSLDQIAALRQPEHADSVGALYIQNRLQQRRFGSVPLVVANENSKAYATEFVAETTSYMVVLYGAFPPGFAFDTSPRDHLYFLAGDTNFGRAMKTALLTEEARRRVVETVLGLTGSHPLIVNLEGVILPNVPDALDNMTLAMPEDLTLEMLKAMRVAGVGLANNHALDLGPTGYAETLQALTSAGIPAFGQGEVLSLPGLDIVGLTDIDTNGSPQTDLLTPPLLDRLERGDASGAVAAFVHWGREYETEPSRREQALADEMRLRAAALIVGSHPHVASAGPVALSGGDTLMQYSTGNFLFDQNADRSSGAIVEVRVFAQGTLFARVLPLPNLFDLAKAARQ